MKRWMAVLLFVPSCALAADLTPAEIVRRSVETGHADAIREQVTMTLVEKGGNRVRAMTVARRKLADGWATRIDFSAPKDVAGTVLLSLDRASADQHLYLPGIRRVRRVSGSQRSGAFMGSDFAYEDLAERPVDKVDFTRLPDEGDDFVVQGVPHKDLETGYGKTVAWIAKSDFLTVRVRFFDKDGAELKTLEVDPTKRKVQGATIIPLHLQMTAKKDGHQTLLDVTAADLAPKLPESLFDPSLLDKG